MKHSRIKNTSHDLNFSNLVSFCPTLVPLPGPSTVPALDRVKWYVWSNITFHIYFLWLSVLNAYSHFPVLSWSLPRSTFQSTYVCPSPTFQPPYKACQPFSSTLERKACLHFPIHSYASVYLGFCLFRATVVTNACDCITFYSICGK